MSVRRVFSSPLTDLAIALLAILSGMILSYIVGWHLAGLCR